MIIIDLKHSKYANILGQFLCGATLDLRPWIASNQWRESFSVNNYVLNSIFLARMGSYRSTLSENCSLLGVACARLRL